MSWWAALVLCLSFDMSAAAVCDSEALLPDDFAVAGSCGATSAG